MLQAELVAEVHTLRQRVAELEGQLARTRKGPETDEQWNARMKSTYGSHLDLDEQDRAMDRWLVRNPTRRKTRRFVQNWLETAMRDAPVAPAEPKKWLVY